jgi:circadian clock protein KaiC
MVGLHALNLSADGVTVFPRLVTPQRAEAYRVYNQRVSTGNKVLDEMLDGGLWQGSMTLILGPTGAGKTTVGLEFAAEAAKRGDSTLYANFQEDPTQLGRRIENLRPDLTAEQSNRIINYYHSPVERHPDSIVGEVYRLVQKHEVSQVVFDSLGDLLHMTGEENLGRLHDYVYSLSDYFALRGITAMLTMESQLAPTGPGHVSGFSRFSQMSSNVIMLESELSKDQTRRSLRVLKTRNSGHETHTRPYHVAKEGLRIER